MRMVVMLVLGLFIGAVGTVMALNALSQGDEFPDGVMAVLSHHTAQVRRSIEADRCDAAAIGDDVMTMRLVARDIEPAFLAEGYEDARFSDHAGHLAQRIDALQASLGQSCRAVGEAALAVGEACKRCHQDYR